MKWKAIGQSIIGISHQLSGKGCEDVVQYTIVQDANNQEVLICCASDGAGSAKFASLAAEFTVSKIVETLSTYGSAGYSLNEKDIYTIVEDVYEGLSLFAKYQEAEINEYSCTLLGCYLTNEQSIFFQIGDGAIVRNDGNGYFTVIWMPQNGEYQNTTCFIVDYPTLGNLKIMIYEEPINEVALFTDGLQLLALNMEGQTVHQPFLNDFFKYLRQANNKDKVEVLNQKLAAYLGSNTIITRTDDDKTLFLATRLGNME